MHFSSRSKKMSILLSIVTVVALLAAILVNTVPRGTAIHAANGPGGGVFTGTGNSTGSTGAPTSTGSPAIAGTATRVSSGKLDESGSPQVPQPPAGVQPQHRLPIEFNIAGSETPPLSTTADAPSVSAVSLANLPASASLQNFNGASSRDSLIANLVGNQTFDVEPPDQGLCVGQFEGQKVVFEPVNLVLMIFTTSGTPLLRESLYTFFNEPLSESIGDARCVFDSATGFFFFTETAVDPGFVDSHVDVVVLSTSGSSALYHLININDSPASGCPCVDDQPLLGIDQFNIYISISEFTTRSARFTGSNVFAISKSQLEAFAPTANTAGFFRVTDGGPILSLQPAISVGNPPAEYLVHSFAVNASANYAPSAERLGVFAIINRDALSHGGLPTLIQPVQVDSIPYVQPDPAPSTGGKLLNADDDRLQQVQYINGHLLTDLSTGFVFGGIGEEEEEGHFCDQGVCDGAAWFQITPQLISIPPDEDSSDSDSQTKPTESTILFAKVTQQGYVAVPNVSLLYPAIAQSPNGSIDMAFSLTSLTLNPSAGVALNVNQSFLSRGHVFVVATGTGPDTGFTCFPPFGPPCRWGDYSWATLDPNSGNFWMGSEYIPPADSQSISANWGTRIYEVAA